MKHVLRKAFRFSYYTVYGKRGKSILINNEPHTVSAHVARGINSTIDEVPLKLLTNLAQKADTVFDVGANVGVISVMLARKMKPGSVIHAFEPAPISYKYMADSARVQQGKARIIPHNYAISNGNGKLHFTNDNHSCTNHISDGPGLNTIAVEAVTLDWFCDTNKLAPQVIKVDVEGAEYWALEGMLQVLKHNNVQVLMEIHQGFLMDHKIDGAMFANVINGIGYKVFDTTGQQISPEQIVLETCVILAKQHPGADIFKI
jgi:FkbM family methyltransferase